VYELTRFLHKIPALYRQQMSSQGDTRQPEVLAQARSHGMIEFKKQRNLLIIVAILLVLSAGMYGLRGSSAATVHVASAPSDFKLPFWGYCIITQGPNTWPSHINLSAEAIDFAPTKPSTWAKGNWNVAVATYPGTVIYSGWDNAGCPNNYSFGNLVVIDHHNGMYSYYAHLEGHWARLEGQVVSLQKRVRWESICTLRFGKE
jgi:hypothetical protein